MTAARPGYPPLLWPEDPAGPQPCDCDTCDCGIRPLHQWRPS